MEPMYQVLLLYFVPGHSTFTSEAKDHLLLVDRKEKYHQEDITEAVMADMVPIPLILVVIKTLAQVAAAQLILEQCPENGTTLNH